MATLNTRIGPRARREKLRDDVREAIESIKMNTTFAAFGSLFPAALIDIGLVVKGIGSVEIPLAPSDGRALVELSAENHRSGDQAYLRGPLLWGFQNVDACDVTLAPAWTGLLEEAVNKVKEAFEWPTNADIEPELIEFIIQTWDSEMVFPSLGFTEDFAHLATLVIFLPSRHDGGRIEISRAGAVMDFNTAQQSESEFHFLAIRYDATVVPTTITAGARVGLLYRLCSKVEDLTTKEDPCHLDTSLVLDDGLSERSNESSPHHYLEVYMKKYNIVAAKPWALRQPFRSESPGMERLRESLSSWIYKASDSQYPSMLIYTLESDYCLDLLSCPDFEGDDLERLHALNYLTGDLGFSLYYTVLSQRVISANDVVETQRILNSDTMVDDHGLEMMLRLHAGTISNQVKGFYVHRYGDKPFRLSSSEVLYNSSSQFANCNTTSRGPRRSVNAVDLKVQFSVVYSPAVLLIPAACVQELEVRDWVALLYNGEENPMREWLDYLLAYGKKEGDWDDDNVELVSRLFLNLTEKAIRPRMVRDIPHAQCWSRALDLVARLGLELESGDIFRQAMTLRNRIDEAFEVPLIKRVETSHALEGMMNDSWGTDWDNLNWWLSIQPSLSDMLDACEYIYDRLIEHETEFERPIPSEVNRLAWGYIRRPLTRTEIEAWRKSRVRDALLNIENPEPGDALQLCKLTLYWNDEMLRRCAIDFLALKLTDADFIISDLCVSSSELERCGFPEEVINRYVLDFILPAIKAGPVVYVGYQKLPLPQNYERLLSIISSGHTLGRDFPRLLVSLAKMFTGTVTDTITFLKLVSTSPYWTTRSVLKEIGTHIVQPALERSSIAEVDLVQRDVNTVDIADLVTVLRLLHDPQVKLSLEARLLRFIALIVTFKHLKLDGLKNELTDDRFRVLSMACDRYWSEQSRVGLPLR